MVCTVRVKSGKIVNEKTDALLLPLFDRMKNPADTVGELDTATDGMITRIVESGDFTGGKYQTALLYTNGTVPAKRIILVGLGKEEECTLDIVRGAGGKAFRHARDLGIKDVTVSGDMAPIKNSVGEAALEAFLTGGLLGIYQFKALVTAERDKIKKLERCVVLARSEREMTGLRQCVRRTRILADAVYMTRDLVSLPANKKTPTILAQKARAVARKEKLTCSVISEAQARKLGMGAFTAVAQGSKEPAKMIVLEYMAGPKQGKPLALVGKGITFDSGGISLKPPARMELMKDDMSGGAAVLGVMQALAQLKLPVNVVGIIPATENLPGGKAYKPGDVLTSLSGQTIEVISTDAEGRLILADALTYALRYKPQAIVDIATLTGACVIALGDYVAGAMGNNEELVDTIKAAGERSGEKVWPLPLWDDYFDYLKCDIADFKNVGTRAGGAITGGMFLRKFVDDTPWVHLDIAGPAWVEKALPYTPKGASGFGVRLILEFISSWNAG